MLDEQLLSDYIHAFFGYGSYSAKTWFIGMEEGGGTTEDEITRRLSYWQSRGRNELEDVCDYHEALGIDQFFREPVKLQRTWAQLCRIALIATGETDDLPAIKTYQKERLGRWNGSTSLLELMPLPSPGTNHWFYSGWSNLKFLASRELYKEKILPFRVQKLKDLIERSKPSSVIFYGAVYWAYWEAVAGSTFTKLNPYGFGWAKKDSTNFLVIQHPAAKGVSNQYFQSAGKLLKKFMHL